MKIPVTEALVAQMVKAYSTIQAQEDLPNGSAANNDYAQYCGVVEVLADLTTEVLTAAAQVLKPLDGLKPPRVDYASGSHLASQVTAATSFLLDTARPKALHKQGLSKHDRQATDLALMRLSTLYKTLIGALIVEAKSDLARLASGEPVNLLAAAVSLAKS